VGDTLTAEGDNEAGCDGLGVGSGLRLGLTPLSLPPLPPPLPPLPPPLSLAPLGVVGDAEPEAMEGGEDLLAVVVMTLEKEGEAVMDLDAVPDLEGDGVPEVDALALTPPAAYASTRLGRRRALAAVPS
jgi:hypothetical protein